MKNVCARGACSHQLRVHNLGACRFCACTGYVAPVPAQCRADGCKRVADGAAGYCNPHYLRRNRRGTVDLKIPLRDDPAARLWASVEKTETCWLWTGELEPAGYGRFRAGRGRQKVYVHRYAYELEVGPIPEGLELDHLCRVRNCVRPSHLEPVTRAENNRRANAVRVVPRMERCRAGLHDLNDPANVYVVAATGKRRCKRCANDRRNADRRRDARLIPDDDAAHLVQGEHGFEDVATPFEEGLRVTIEELEG